MADIISVNFKPKTPDIVYSCVCGSQLFYINSSFSDDIVLECRSCNMMVNNLKLEFEEEEYEET